MNLNFRIITCLLLFLSQFNFAQTPYPQDYFGNPLDIELILAGSFGELRSNHFHSGLDIKTKQREGLKVLSVADGYVSRIKVAHFGYGKAIYVTHPNGYVSVYGHLKTFSPTIEAYVKAKQYEQESFEIELFPNPEELPLIKGDTIAFSGNTGGSHGPHLHFEIRDNEERPINPLLFGYDIKDTRKPLINYIYAYPLDSNSHVNTYNYKQKLRLIPNKTGNYTVENIDAYGNIGFGIGSIDQQDLASNKNGVYLISTSINGVTNYEAHFKRFSFDESKHINRYIDYEHYKTEKERIQKLFIDTNNPLNLYNNVINNGKLKIDDSTSSVYKIAVSDFKNNVATLNININGKKEDRLICDHKPLSTHYIYANNTNQFEQDKYKVNFYKDTFYDDFYIDFNVKNDTLTLHKPEVAVSKSFKIEYDISAYNPSETDHLYIARLEGWKNYPVYSSTKREDQSLVTYTKSLGTYVIASDTIAPTITAKNFKNNAWISKLETLIVNIDDAQTGISNYRATINDQWVLMEYDYKKKTLTYNFEDKNFTDAKHLFKLIVTDNVGNSTIFESTFYRKTN